MTVSKQLITLFKMVDTLPSAEMDANADFIVVLAALCCALLGTIGLAMLVRCSCVHQLFRSATSLPDQLPPPPGLRRTAVELLPTVRYSSPEVYTDCPICLTEFSDGDLMRVLPLCGHVFHVKCIDTWLGCRSSCPSCRQVVMEAARCRLSGGSQRRLGNCTAVMEDMELALA